jgi:electron transfer flavoprotein alpha subunit
MYATVDGAPKDVTRNFSEHILRNYLFDLTLTSFGSRLYTGKMDPSTAITATYFKFSTLSDYNTSELKKINIKGAQIVVIGGYGMAGGKDGFKLIHELADVLGGEVGATRAAVDAGMTEHERQVGQTGVTIRPKLCIACGVSGAVQHRAGMEQSSKIISINTDPNAPINAIADYTIIGDAFEIIPQLIKHYKNNTK